MQTPSQGHLMSGRRRSRKRRKPKGFSEPGSRQLLDIMFGLTGIRGKEKRTLLNQCSSQSVLIVGVICGFLGYQWFGFWGTIVGFMLSVVLMGKLVTGGRFYR